MHSDAAVAAESKACSSCKTIKPFTDFSSDAGNADGKRRRCKACVSDANARAKATQDAEASGEQFAVLPIGQVVTSLTNPRQTFDEVKLGELADSIRASGVHQPILVRALPINRVDETSRGRERRPAWEIVAGERRYRASKLAGRDTIPAMIKQLTDDEVLEIQIVENLQRDDLTELEEAEGYQRLVERTGTAKEDIGTKIGRSRSYVYQRLKLLDLDTTGREAMRAGKLDASKAILIARIPDAKQQIKALEAAGRGLSFKDLQTWIQTNVMLTLKRTRFDITDVTLRPEAGACPSCPKRTGASPDLFSDVESPDLCTDPSCYHDKERTHDDRRFEEAEREGKKVISAEKAVKLQRPYGGATTNWLSGYYVLDAYPEYELDVATGNTLRRSLGKHCPEPVLVKHPETQAVCEVLPIDLVKKLIATHGLSRTAKAAQQKAETAKVVAKLPVKDRPEYRERWQHAALRAADAKLRTMAELPAELLRAWLVDQLDSYDSGGFGPALDLGTEFDEEVARQRVLAMHEAELPTLMLRYMLWGHESGYHAWNDENEQRQAPRTTLFELLHLAGVDLEATRADVKREIEGEDRAAELEAKEEKKRSEKKSLAPPAAPELRARKPKTSKGVKGSAAPKTSAADARGAIAAAMQAAEGEQDQAPGGAGLDEPAALAEGLHPSVTWPFPTSAREPEAVASAALSAAADEAAPTFSIGAIARIKAISKADAKLVGKVGRVAGIGDDGRVHLRHGPKPRDLIVLQPAHLEPYLADPNVDDTVRIVALTYGQEEKLHWCQGKVMRLRADGWEVLVMGKDWGQTATFEPSQLEVLA